MTTPRLTAGLLAATILLAACSGPSETTTQAGSTSEPSVAPTVGTEPANGAEPGVPAAGSESPSPSPSPSPGLTVADIDAPDVEVLSVPSGDRLNVAELALGRDILFWFYAPH